MSNNFSPRNSITLFDYDDYEIKYIMSLKNSDAGHDDLPVTILKNSS